jgi:class 3 adenylate cyclase
MLFEGDDYIGPAPNLAARLCDEAAGIGVLIPTDHIIELPLGVKTQAHTAIKLHGFADPVEVAVLVGQPVLAERQDTSEIWAQRPVIN